MKYVVSRAESPEKVFDEIDFAELRANDGAKQNKMERLGDFVRVTQAGSGSIEVFGLAEMQSQRPGERRFSVAGAIGNFIFSADRASQAQDAGARAGGTRTIRSSMPGRVARVLCKVGDAVSAGQPLLVLEAMKMENEICSPIDGKVEQVDAAQDKKVETGEALIKIAP